MKPITALLVLSALLPNVLAAESLFAVVQTDTVQVWNVGIEINCAARFIIDSHQSQDTLYVIETDTSSLLATCTCNFDLCDTVVGLPPGSYWAVVYRTILKKYPFTRDTTFFVGSVPFTLSTPTTWPFAHSQFQSYCYYSSVRNSPTDAPTSFRLAQNYPNPFNPTSTITYSLPRREHVRLEVFDVLGRSVSVLVDEPRSQGSYQLQITSGALPSSGVYFYRMIAGGFVTTRAMIVLR
jgi:hypothetical protein